MNITTKKQLPILLKILVALFFLYTGTANCAISVVYNFKIAESTKHPAFHRPDAPFSFTNTGFNTNRKKRNDIHHNAGGVLSTFSYIQPSYYLRTDFAFGKINESRIDPSGNRLTFSRTQTDDLLFSGGYSFINRERIKVTLSGFLGVPTHKENSLLYFQFGLAQVGLGTQLDAAFLYSSRSKHTIRVAARCIHFFGRRTLILVEDTLKSFHYSLGNLVDFFIAHHQVYDQHSVEVGFNETLLLNSKICPYNNDAIKKTQFIRSSFYTTYKYRFTIRKIHNAVAAAFSYGFDSKSKEFGNKRILTSWALWSVSF